MAASVEPDDISSTSFSNPARALLAMLESFRKRAARRLVEDYPLISEPDLNEAILLAVLRVLWVRIGQECGLTGPGMLALLADSDGIDRRLYRACEDAGLNPDTLRAASGMNRGPLPRIGDPELRDMIKLAGSEDFPVLRSQLSLDEIATVFEHYLGTRMQAAEGNRVNRVSKSAMLYTGIVNVPHQTVVEYVVRRSATSIQSAPDSRKGIRILDPACGTGIFLLAAYRVLAGRDRGSADRTGHNGEWLRELVCRSVFGTDIDPESVITARFILLLGYIRELQDWEGSFPTPVQIRQVVECLRQTIRCGNALITPDYFSDKQVHPFNAEKRWIVNPFDWHEEFSEVLAAGGFDAVVGAPPPYRPFAVKEREEYFQTHYDTYAPGAGLYSYFTEQGLRLLRPGGTLALLLPGTFLRQQHARPLRRLLLTRQILEIADTGRSRLLQGEEERVYALLIRNQPPDQPFVVPAGAFGTREAHAGASRGDRYCIDQRSLDDGGWTLVDKRTENLQKKLQSAGTPLEEYVMGAIYHGIKTGLDKAFVIDEKTRHKLIEEDPKSTELFKPFLAGKDIKRYRPSKGEKSLVFLPQGWTNSHAGGWKNTWKWLKKKYPSVTRHLEPFSKEGEKRSDKGDYWWELRGCDYYPAFEKPKIIYPEILQKPEFTFDETGCYANNKCFIIPVADKFLLGILNSTLTYFLFETNLPRLKAGFFVPANVVWKNFPVYTPDFDNPNDKARHDRMVTLVTEMLELHKHLSLAKTDQEKRIITQEIESTDRQIDSLVYGLYGLTADEIAVVEENTRK